MFYRVENGRVVLDREWWKLMVAMKRLKHAVWKECLEPIGKFEYKVISKLRRRGGVK